MRLARLRKDIPQNRPARAPPRATVSQCSPCRRALADANANRSQDPSQDDETRRSSVTSHNSTASAGIVAANPSAPQSVARVEAPIYPVASDSAVPPSTSRYSQFRFRRNTVPSGGFLRQVFKYVWGILGRPRLFCFFIIFLFFPFLSISLSLSLFSSSAVHFRLVPTRRADDSTVRRT